MAYHLLTPDELNEQECLITGMLSKQNLIQLLFILVTFFFFFYQLGLVALYPSPSLVFFPYWVLYWYH